MYRLWLSNGSISYRRFAVVLWSFVLATVWAGLHAPLLPALAQDVMAVHTPALGTANVHPNVRTPTRPHITVSPSVVNFGIVPVGTVATQTFTVANTGAGDLQVSGIALGGTLAQDFVLQHETCVAQRLAATASCTVSVAFAPAAGGPMQAMLAVSSSASDTITVEICGAGQAEAAETLEPQACFCASTAAGTPACVAGTATDAAASQVR